MGKKKSKYVHSMMCSKIAITTQERDLGDTTDSSVEMSVQYLGEPER